MTEGNGLEPAPGEKAGPFKISISGANIEFRTVEIADRKITGAQIVEAAGEHKVEDFVVLQHLPNHELASLRPDEVLDLGEAGIERFFVIEGADLHRFFVDGLSMLWPLPKITGEHILDLRGADEDHELVLERDGQPDEIIHDDQEVQLDEPHVERFKTRPLTRHVKIFVDGEPYEAPKRRMTPDEIIKNATGKNPAENYLVQITGGHRDSYQGKGEIPIRLRDGMKFQVIYTGPTPVSESNARTGVELFAASLRELGYEPVPLPKHADHLVFNYKVQSGKYAGQEVRLGFVIPRDFSVTPPSGPYVSPEIHPIKPDQSPHPTGAVHKNQARPFDEGAGGSWQYWSRPFPGWGVNGRSTVANYMSYIWKLWDTQ
jgi:hypothetical protein